MSGKIRDDEMFCPECGAPIKKGFFTCANCKIKVRLTREINKEQNNYNIRPPEQEKDADKKVMAKIITETVMEKPEKPDDMHNDINEEEETPGITEDEEIPEDTII